MQGRDIFCRKFWRVPFTEIGDFEECTRIRKIGATYKRYALDGSEMRGDWKLVPETRVATSDDASGTSEGSSDTLVARATRP